MVEVGRSNYTFVWSHRLTERSLTTPPETATYATLQEVRGFRGSFIGSGYFEARYRVYLEGVHRSQNRYFPTGHSAHFGPIRADLGRFRPPRQPLSY